MFFQGLKFRWFIRWDQWSSYQKFEEETTSLSLIFTNANSDIYLWNFWTVIEFRGAAVNYIPALKFNYHWGNSLVKLEYWFWAASESDLSDFRVSWALYFGHTVTVRAAVKKSFFWSDFQKSEIWVCNSLCIWQKIRISAHTENHPMLTIRTKIWASLTSPKSV